MDISAANLGLNPVLLIRESLMQGESKHAHKNDVDHLVYKAQAGEEYAFGQLYEYFYDRIFRYVMFKTGDRNEAEDITTEVFLRMLESIGSFKFQGYPFSSWLFRIAHNLIVDYFRKKSRRKIVPLEEASTVAENSVVDFDNRIDAGRAAAEVYSAMDGLTDLQKEVLSLRFAAGLSVKETAEAVGKKENAVKALQHAAIKKLRSLLDVSPKKDARMVTPNTG